MTKTCPYCGKTFESSRPTLSVYCSDACRQAAYRDRKQGKPEPTKQPAQPG